jgi:hypothetical protein
MPDDDKEENMGERNEDSESREPFRVMKGAEK